MLPEILSNPIVLRNHVKFKLCIDADKPKLEKDHEYIDYTLSILERSVCHPLFGPMLNDLECKSTDLHKSLAKAEHFRILGNNLFKDGRMAEALHLYTFSISFATPGSFHLALAYGNRSAVLFNKHYYKECLEDIERALEINYPEEKKEKLIKRQADAKKWLHTQKKVTYHGVVPTITNRNPNIPSASDSITIIENKQYGRHIVATRTINPGEVLLVEKPYSCFVSLSDTKDPTYCSECSELCFNLIPCKKCAGVLYCSKECRKRAFVSYHRHECTIMTTFGYDIINWNATRMTLKAIKEYDEKETNTDEYRSDRYLELSKLSYHKGRNLPDTLETKAAGVAKVFYTLKKYTDIFAELDMDEEEIVLKTLLFKNACITNRNSAAIEINCRTFGKKVGSAIYSVFSLFNHACAENVERSAYGSTVVLKATKKIKKGEQCFINYGMSPMGKTVQERRKELEMRYFFTCKCFACEQNWPIVREYPIEDPAVSSLCIIRDGVIFSENLSKRKKKILLEETFLAAEKAELICPFLTYFYCQIIYKNLLFDGNQNIEF